MTLKKLAPWVAAVLSLGGAIVAALPARPVNGFDLEAFGRLPVLQGGRIKPLDTVARNALLAIRSQQSFSSPVAGSDPAKPDQAKKETITPTRWLLDALFRPEVADAQPAFVINDPQVLGMLHIDQGPSRYYPFTAIAPYLDEVQRQAMAANGVPAQKRAPFQSAIVNLAERVWMYQRLKGTVQVPGTPGLPAALAAAATPQGAQQQQLLDDGNFRPAPAVAGAAPDDWRSVGQALAAVGAGRREPALEGWAQVGEAWKAQDAPAFNGAVGALTQHLELVAPAKVRQAWHELVFNRAQPFYAGMVIFILALLTLFVSWLWQGELLRPAAFGFLGAGLVVQTAGLATRIILQGRPPVTNLYSSAVFVGWAIVVLAVILEYMYRQGFATLVGGAMGFSSLLVAHHLGTEGDTMEMMRAVLDSNFWLGTHVVTITIGYAGTFLAGGLAIAWTVHRQLVGGESSPVRQALASMTYGVVCFAVFFSFVGTVLGGIWADQSWGRFWGWDPKENGALLIVLWNAVILHARWGGYARERGMMAMAIFGNVITSLSWFGVNMLGVGLHSYGFMDSAFKALAAFIGSQLVLIAFTMLPPLFASSSARRSSQEPRADPRAG
jgi:ABC-type transport system involved in cytochrome c biogenesis permease subunit